MQSASRHKPPSRQQDRRPTLPHKLRLYPGRMSFPSSACSPPPVPHPSAGLVPQRSSSQLESRSTTNASQSRTLSLSASGLSSTTSLITLALACSRSLSFPIARMQRQLQFQCRACSTCLSRPSRHCRKATLRTISRHLLPAGPLRLPLLLLVEQQAMRAWAEKRLSLSRRRPRSTRWSTLLVRKLLSVSHRQVCQETATASQCIRLSPRRSTVYQGSYRKDSKR